MRAMQYDAVLHSYAVGTERGRLTLCAGPWCFSTAFTWAFRYPPSSSPVSGNTPCAVVYPITPALVLKIATISR